MIAECSLPAGRVTRTELGTFIKWVKVRPFDRVKSRRIPKYLMEFNKHAVSPLDCADTKQTRLLSVDTLALLSVLWWITLNTGITRRSIPSRWNRTSYG